MSDIKLGAPNTTNKAKRRNYVKKVEHQWSHDEIIQLIGAVEERRVLWDIGAPEYKLPKTDAWQEVANLIGNIQVDDAKAKWTNLRIAFKNNLAKYRLKKSGQGTDEAVIIHWRYFKSLMFLEVNDIQQSTESTSSLSLASANTDASVLADFSVPPPPTVGTRKRRSNGPSPTPSQTPRTDEMREVALNALSSLRVHEDRFGAFGEYIASELRALPLDQGTNVQRALNRELLRLLEDVETQEQSPSMSFLSPVVFVDENGRDIESSTVNLDIMPVNESPNEQTQDN